MPTIHNLKYLELGTEKYDTVSQKESFIYIYIYFLDLEFGNFLMEQTQECVIKVNKFGKGVSQYSAVAKKLGNKIRSEG